MSPPVSEEAAEDNVCLVARCGATELLQMAKPEEKDDILAKFDRLNLGEIPVKSYTSSIKSRNEKNVVQRTKSDIDLLLGDDCRKSQTKAKSPAPAEFFQMHRMRTSGLARKTNTTTNFGGGNPDLFAELQKLHISEKSPHKNTVEKTAKQGNNQITDKDKKDDADDKSLEKLIGKPGVDRVGPIENDSDLIQRTPGPIQSSRAGRNIPGNHPYLLQARNLQNLPQNQQPLLSCADPQQYFSQLRQLKTPVNEKNEYSDQLQQQPYFSHFENDSQIANQGSLYYDYTGDGCVNGGIPADPCFGPCMSNGDYSPNHLQEEFTPPGSMVSVHARFMPLEHPILIPPIPFADSFVTSEELNRLLDVPAELPEALSDFILKYSRRYSTDTQLGSHCTDSSLDGRSSSRKSSASESSAGSSPKHTSGGQDEGAGCDSPLSAGSAPQSSPSAPRGGRHTPITPGSLKQLVNGHCKRFKPILPKQLSPNRKCRARERLRSMIPDGDHDMAWIWALKCVQACPGAFYYRDPDGDSLLHIVVWHKDLPKVYALVELLLKTDYQTCPKLFDLPNRVYETPLFLAVEKRLEEVTSYLLECGANPNHLTRRNEGDAPLHYAAARGMTEIVDALCALPHTDKNIRNILGLSPLLCAVRNHGVIEEESQCLVNNKPTIRALLKAGADPKIPDAQSGKTVLHYAVERMDPELVEIYRDNLDKDSMYQLVNMPSYEGETAIQMLGRMGSGQHTGVGALGRLEAEDELRRKMFLTLVNCGAEIPAHGEELPAPPDPTISSIGSPFDCC